MKVLALISSVVVATVLLFGSALLIVVTAHHTGALVLLATVASTLLIYGPLLVGALSSYWDVRGSRYFRRVLVVTLALDALGAIAIIVFTVLAGAPAWLPIVFIVGGAVLMAIAVLVGRALYRRSPPATAPEGDWSPVSPRDIQRRVLIVAGVFVAVFVLGFLIFLALDGAGEGFASTLGFALQFALLAGSITCIIVTIPLNRRLRSTVGGNLDDARTVARVVLGRKPLELDPGQQRAAARYATVAPTALSFTVSYFVMLYGALFLQQIRLLAQGRDVPVQLGLLVFLAAFLVFFVPYYIVRIRRAQQYARDHAELLGPAPDLEDEARG